ncbi:flagellar protein FlgN [Microbacterium suaedae]|uniref:flagellar protein FlgN n=1 Tax=Microbacterium suaedae TaxID=2067813 RepID=UPI001E481081|nr:flagellar protein FlgN [Microbacterium suaedae]
MPAHDLSLQLWRERELLELMLFKLETLQTLLATGQNRWISHATVEVERVVDALSSVSLLRATMVASVGEEWGAGGNASLRELIENAPEDVWRDVFREHRDAMLRLATEIQGAKDVGEQRVRTALRVTQETIAGLGAPTGAYDDSGGVVRDGSSRLLDTNV